MFRKYNMRSILTQKIKEVEYKKIIIILLPLLLSLIIRLSFVFKYMGFDTYEVYWMANAIRNGALIDGNNTWLVNFLSYFGFFPFSHYPIGTPMIFALILSLGFNVNSASYIFTLIIISVTYFGSLKLSKIYFEDQKSQLIFSFLLVNMPVFFGISFMTVHPRSLFFALLPWILYYMNKILIKFDAKNLTSLVFLLLLSTLTHRLWLGLFLYLALFIFSHILLKTNIHKKIRLSRKQATILVFTFLVLNLILISISFRFFKFDTTKINSPWFTNETYLGKFINIIFDYSTRLGPMILFLPISILYYMKTLYQLATGKFRYSNNNFIKTRYFLLISFFIFSLTFIFTLYSTILLLPILAIYIVDGLNYVKNNVKKNKTIYVSVFAIFNLTICFLYMKIIEVNIIWLNILIIILSVFISLFLISFLVSKYIKHNLIANIIKKFKNKKIKRYYNLILIFITITFFSVNQQYTKIASSEKRLTYIYISNEELEVIDKIREVGINGIIFVFDVKMAKHINAYSNFPTIRAYHHQQQLYYNWTNELEIISNSYFDIRSLLTKAELFIINYNNEIELFNLVNNIDVRDEGSITSLKNNSIQYCIALKIENQIFPYTVTTIGKAFSKLIHSSAFIESFFETESLIVWKYY